MGKGARFFAKKRKANLKKDNLMEDKVIKSLEKKLKFNKKSTKSLPKSFMADGLDYLLDICDNETRKLAAESEKRLVIQSDDELDISDYDSDSKRKPIIKKKNDIKKLKTLKHTKLTEESFSESEDGSLGDISDSEDICDYSSDEHPKEKKKSKGSKKFKSLKTNKSHMEVDDDDDNSNKNVGRTSKTKKIKIGKTEKLIISKEKKPIIPTKKAKVAIIDAFEEDEFIENERNLYSFSSGEESSSNLEEEDSNLNEDEKGDMWEDIYGRKRDKDGNIITENKQKYIPPAQRLKEFENNAEKSEKQLLLRRQIKGLLNRLAESNMHAIISQLDELYMSNSRNDMNQMLSKLMIESIIAPVLTAERLVTEHMMCIAILHANIDTQIGAHFIMVLIKKFNEMIQLSQDVENKELDNLVLMICHLYNFKVFGSQLVYEILNKFIEKFNEKEIEVILLILKTAGFRLRKDDPLALKELILKLQQKATVKSSNTRIQFMLDILLAIKNNNMNKIPQYDQSYVEHLKKIIKTLIRKGNSVTQLSLSLEDLLNADERGKWWIVGSAWSGKTIADNKSTKTSENKPVYSKKILELAKAQRMNTDARKNIFCVLMTAEDYLDAFEKLHHLGLKDRQEREIIHVILNCCLQEKNFNPYYAAVIQKFCEYDRKYVMTIQYTLWDKFKMLNDYSSKQVINMAKLLSYLFLKKALPLSILKVIQLGELDAVTMKLFKKIMLDILLHENTEICLSIFERIATASQLHQFREGLRLFINYFLLKNIKKEKQNGKKELSTKQMQLLEKRIELVDRILITSSSKVSF